MFVAVLITVSGYAQKTADIGIWGGSSTVFGDLDEDDAFRTFNLNFGAYFRYNVNARVGIRAMYLYGSFTGDGQVELTPWQYDKNVHDVTLQAEINYLRYILGSKKMRFSPYVTIGLGMAFFTYELRPAEILLFNSDYPDLYDGVGNIRPDEEESVATPTIPFGIGAKYTIGSRLGVGVEYQMRKYMSDQLDDLDDPLKHVNGMGELISYNKGNHNNDWVGYLGVHVTYKFYIGKTICPAYDSKNW